MLHIFFFVLLLGSSASARLTPTQTKALQLVLNWIHDPQLGRGRTPASKQFRTADLPLTYDRVVGAGIYRDHPKTLFHSPDEFWLALSAFAREQERPISLLQTIVYKPSPELLEHLREEAMQAVLSWVRTHRRLPRYADFGRNPGQIPVHFYRLTSSGIYQNKYGLYPGVGAFWEAFASRAICEEELAPLVSQIQSVPF